FTLYYHPLSSFCWKALIALYEADIAFEPRLVNLGDPADRAAFQAVWPLAKFPVLRDNARGKTIPESSIVIDYLARTEP
ncbi:glutathione S-transferase family protein, partial [Mycobacterium tuberculosis]